MSVFPPFIDGESLWGIIADGEEMLRGEKEAMELPQPPDPLRLEPATPEDVDEIHRIERTCFTMHWSRQQLLRDLSNTRTTYYAVARWGEEIVGYAGMYLIEEEAHVTTLAVLPAYRRRGIGLRLMLHLIRVARQRGAKRMTLEVRVSNHGARALYQRLGFYDVALRRHYYVDTGEDAIIMWIPNLHASWLEARWRREAERWGMRWEPEDGR